ncbi:MAG TPA: hypothetical protein VN668_13520 [Stellaceae bacterium]|nr:hypothetical protein [Stellaceae bacterium]
MEIAAWLQRLGLQQYEAAFREHAVNTAVLSSLTAEDLKELGVAAVGHRRKLLDAIAALPERSPAEGAIRTIGKVAPPSSPAVPAGERRRVTVLFADLAGFRRLGAEHDAEEVHARLSAVFDAADRIRRREIVGREIVA